MKIKDVDLTCEYVHEEEKVKVTDQVKFLWHIESHGCKDTCEIKVRCNNVLERGVPFPERWKRS